MRDFWWTMPVLFIVLLLIFQATGEMFVESVWGRNAMFKFNEKGFRFIGLVSLPLVLLSLALGIVTLLSS